MVPAAFQSRRVLEVLNVAAVGFALAAVTSAVFAAALGTPDNIAPTTGLPTWIIGTLWALFFLRWPKVVGASWSRWVWASVPFAVLDSTIAGGLAMGLERGWNAPGFALGALFGATVGALFWIPSLIVTLLCFGVPIASARRLAEKGLAGRERGEWIVGTACVLMSLLGLLVPLGIRIEPGWDAYPFGVWVIRTFAVLGLLTGGATTIFALAREGRRRKFVADAEAGRNPGYRVDTTDEGKVLIRVVSRGEGYRVADFEEELYELDAEGQATRPKHMDGARDAGDILAATKR